MHIWLRAFLKKIIFVEKSESNNTEFRRNVKYAPAPQSVERVMTP